MRPGLVGVISDTHGLLRADAVAALRGCDLIVHAGDVGGPAVLDGLRRLGRVVAVRGNMDGGSWAEALPETEAVEVGGSLLFVLHDRHRLALTPRVAGIAAVISGHSHRPRIERRDGVLWLNPGSAGPRRFRLPVSLALLRVAGPRLEARLVELDPEGPAVGDGP